MLKASIRSLWKPSGNGSTMVDSVVAAVAGTVGELATFILRLPLQWRPSPSSSTPNCSIDKIQEDIGRLGRTLARIRARLNEAEKMEITDALVHLWLRELEGVSYSAEDVLDELLYQMLHLQSGSGRTKHEHVPAFLVPRKLVEAADPSSTTPSNEILAFLLDVERRIGEVNRRFQEISEHRVALQLEGSNGQKWFRFEAPARQPTTSLMEFEESGIIGREEDLRVIKKFLLSDMEFSWSNGVPVVAIVGMGGLGKTTLAQLAYNDNEVSKQFDPKSWVCVSEGFDLVRVTRAMIESFTGEACHLSELNALQIMLKRVLAERCFLLVLDDVWEQEGLLSIWARLRAPLLGGSRGSKVIITTRSEEVARIVGVVSTHHLPCLQESDCLRVFTDRAFEGRDPASHSNLRDLGLAISRKCGGVPLVAKILGGQLCWEDDEQKWRDILEGDVWDLDRKGIMPVLRLSYDHLPAHLRRCFRYCSLFPKDYAFHRDTLVRMWLAQGYIEARGTRNMEDIGKGYFDDLLRRSFFQCSSNRQTFYMHYLIHDLARLVSRDECYSLEDGRPCSDPEGDIRHFSIISDRDPMMDTVPVLQPAAALLRSFLFIRTARLSECKMNHLNVVVTGVKNLRVLDLSHTDISCLPDSIGCLQHLRYLALQFTSIRQLPESMGTLYHLQTLDLDLCFALAYLPSSTSQLVNLRHLICEHHVTHPEGIRKLTNLQTMSGFIVSSVRGCAKLGELEGLNNIRSLHISKLNMLTDVAEAKKACLEKKVCLRDLHLEWADRPPLPFDDEVLEVLRPNSNLRRLWVSGFAGRSIPSWLQDRSFSNLVSVHVNRCKNWVTLPPFGWLPSLKNLSIWSAHKVEHIGREFFSGGFPRLEKLDLCNMYKWRSWCGAQGGECPHLRELIISSCYNLVSLSLMNLDALQVLEIDRCFELELLPDTLHLWQLSSLRRIDISKVLGADYIGGDSLGGFQWLEALHLEHVHRWPAAAEGAFPRLHQLDVRRCEDLTSLPLHSLHALECLQIKDCPRLLFSNEDQLPLTLKEFRICGCPLLTLWCQRHIQRLVQIPLSQVEGLDIHHFVLRNVLDEEEAADIGLADLEDLQILELVWDSDAGLRSALTGTELVEEVLENLRPHVNVEGLVIQGYTGRRFATWVGDPSFSNLSSITILGCSWCELLPPLGQLPHLRELTIKHCCRLRALPKLPLELKELELDACDKFASCPPLSHLLHLQTLRISDLPSLGELPKLPCSLKELALKNLPELTDPQIPMSVRNLTLQGCRLTLVASLPCLTNLTCLKISHLPGLRKPLQLQNLLALQELYISSCPELESLHCFNLSSSYETHTEGLQALESLRCLTLADCPKLCFSTNERPPSMLRYLSVSSCPLIGPWCDRHLSRWENSLM